MSACATQKGPHAMQAAGAWLPHAQPGEGCSAGRCAALAAFAWHLEQGPLRQLQVRGRQPGPLPHARRGVRRQRALRQQGQPPLLGRLSRSLLKWCMSISPAGGQAGGGRHADRCVVHAGLWGRESLACAVLASHVQIMWIAAAVAEASAALFCLHGRRL